MMYGLDIGGTKIELAVFDSEDSKIADWRVDTPHDNYSALLSAISSLVDRADARCNESGTVGIGIAGTIDDSGRSTSANIPCTTGRNLVFDISDLLSRPVIVENDSKAFVYSEANGGSAAGAKHVLGLALGTGIAGGLCIGGERYLGRQRIAGEYGHIPLASVVQSKYDIPMQTCNCGLNNCVERYLSGPGLLWMAKYFGCNVDSVPALVRDYENGDRSARTALTAYIDSLGCFLAGLTLMFDPDVIVLGGGVSNVSHLYPALPERISAYLFEGVSSPPVVPPKFGDSSGVRGAALLGRLAGSSNESQ